MTACATPLSPEVLESSDSRLELLPTGHLSFLHGSRCEWTSAGSLFLLHYYDRQHPRAQVVAVPIQEDQAFGTAGTPSFSASASFLTVRTGERSWRITARFQRIDISIPLDIELDADGDGFTVRIDDREIVEDNPRLYRILGVELLPDFGSAHTGEAGYLTLPNWSGCQTFFDKSYPREVRQTVYSSNDQWEHVCSMPVFGITRDQGTLCGLIAAGDFDAQLICRSHWERAESNGVHPLLVYRWQQEDDRIAGPRRVRYRFAASQGPHGEGYAFCGNVYRDFLRAERGLKTWTEKGAERPEALDYRDRFFLKIFMAYKEPQADGKGRYHATCTFHEAKEILADCLKRGMRRLSAILVGWGIDGHDGMPPTRFPVDERLGGEGALRELVAWCRESDILLGLHDSYGGAYSCSPEFDAGDLIRHRSGEYWESVIWSGGQAHNICPAVYLDKHVKRDIPAIAKLGIHGHHHIDAIGSFMTCHSPDHPVRDRAAFAGLVRQMFQFITQTLGSASTEYPFGPYFDVIDGYFHCYADPHPWHRSSSVGRYFLDRPVPLLEIALHGSIKLGESSEKFEADPLLWLDWGLDPQYEVCTRPSPAFGIPAYAEKAGLLEKVYRLYYGESDLVRRLSDGHIEARRELAPGVAATRYSNGMTVHVNRSNALNQGLPPHSYRIDRPGAPGEIVIVDSSFSAS